MPPNLPQTTSLPTSSLGRRGPDARPVSLVLASTGRASETRDQSAARVVEILRRTPDVAEPGEVVIIEGDKHIRGAGMVFVTIGVIAILIALVATATVLVMRWFA